MNEVESFSETVGLIFVGWLLGILGPIIVERVSKRRQKAELKIAVQSELNDLKIRLILFVYLLRRTTESLDEEILIWMRTSVHDYNGFENVESLQKLLNKIDFSNKEALPSVINSLNHGSTGAISLKFMNIGFLNANLQNLYLFEQTFQTRLLEIKYGIDSLNQEIQFAIDYLKMTFDQSITGKNRVVLETDLKNKYGYIATMCKSNVERIKKIPKK